MPAARRSAGPGAPAAVDALFASLPEAYRPIAEALRASIRAAGPHLLEAVKWNNPFWVGDGDVLCLQCYDDHVNLGVMRGAELAPRFSRIEGTGRAMRHVKVATPAEARSGEVTRIVRAAIALDRAGASRRSR
jgi:hypothetical protein